MNTLELPCNCTSVWQDKTYGKGIRLMNGAFSKGSKPKRYRCTVCNREVER